MHSFIHSFIRTSWLLCDFSTTNDAVAMMSGSMKENERYDMFWWSSHHLSHTYDERTDGGLLLFSPKTKSPTFRRGKCEIQCSASRAGSPQKMQAWMECKRHKQPKKGLSKSFTCNCKWVHRFSNNGLGVAILDRNIKTIRLSTFKQD